MTKLKCRGCGRKIADLEPDGRATVEYKGITVVVKDGLIGCGHFINRGRRPDGTSKQVPCPAMTPVEVRMPIPV
jgi:hypothetical protein